MSPQPPVTCTVCDERALYILSTPIVPSGRDFMPERRTQTPACAAHLSVIASVELSIALRLKPVPETTIEVAP